MTDVRLAETDERLADPLGRAQPARAAPVAGRPVVAGTPPGVAGGLSSPRRRRLDASSANGGTTSVAVVKPLRAIGDFFAMAMDTFVLMFRPPFAWREFLLQTWFVARVSILPTMFLTIPFTVLVVFTFNILLIEFGAADYSGTGAAIATVTQIGPV